MTDGAMYHRPTMLERFWRSIGFRYHLVDLPDDLEPSRGWMMTRVHLDFSLADRLRLLLTGRLRLDIRQAPNVAVDDCISAASWRIAAPYEIE